MDHVDVAAAAPLVLVQGAPGVGSVLPTNLSSLGTFSRLTLYRRSSSTVGRSIMALNISL